MPPPFTVPVETPSSRRLRRLLEQQDAEKDRALNAERWRRRAGRNVAPTGQQNVDPVAQSVPVTPPAQTVPTLPGPFEPARPGGTPLSTLDTLNAGPFPIQAFGAPPQPPFPTQAPQQGVIPSNPASPRDRPDLRTFAASLRGTTPEEFEQRTREFEPGPEHPFFGPILRGVSELGEEIQPAFDIAGAAFAQPFMNPKGIVPGSGGFESADVYASSPEYQNLPTAAKLAFETPALLGPGGLGSALRLGTRLGTAAGRTVIRPLSRPAVSSTGRIAPQLPVETPLREVLELPSKTPLHETSGRVPQSLRRETVTQGLEGPPPESFPSAAVVTRFTPRLQLELERLQTRIDAVSTRIRALRGQARTESNVRGPVHSALTENERVLARLESERTALGRLPPTGTTVAQGTEQAAVRGNPPPSELTFPEGAGLGRQPRVERGFPSPTVAEIAPARAPIPQPANVPSSPLPPPPPRRLLPTGGVPEEPENVLARVIRQRTPGEPPPVTLLRRHEAAINSAQREARLITDEGGDRILRIGIGAKRGGRVVSRERDIPELDQLYEALHNPSRVEAGDIIVPSRLRGEYDELRRLTDWEEASRIDFDPEMATVHDYFYRGWKAPQEITIRGTQGSVGIRPPFKKPRVDATFREMRDAGFEPLFWNPYEQWRASRLQGVRFRQQTQLIDDLKQSELAVPDYGGPSLPGWRTPQIGPAFQGKPMAVVRSDGTTQQFYTNRWTVSDDLANRLENIYGVRPNLGKVHVGGREIDLMNAVDAATFLPKRLKLFGSFFQQMDFLTRSGAGAGWGAADSLFRGQPIEAARRLAVWPKSAAAIVEANFSPSARRNILKALNSTAPIVEGRPGVHLKGISDAGLSTMDVTLLPGDIDHVARVVAQEHGLSRAKGISRAIASFEGASRRGLFEGVYPAAQIADIRNNIARAVVRNFPEATDEAINGIIARMVNVKYSTIPASQSVFQNRVIREFLRRTFFSIGESEGLLRQAIGLVKGPYKALWAQHWLGAYGFVIATANAIHFASTGEPLPFDRWTPVSKDSFGPLPFGYNTRFASPDIPIDGRGGTKTTLDLVGQLDTAFRILDPKSFITARESVPVRAAMNQYNATDFFGAPIDNVGPDGIVSRTTQLLADVAAPIGVGQAGLAILREKVGVAERLIPIGEQRLGTTGLGVQAVGLNLRAETTPDLLDRHTNVMFPGKTYRSLEPNERRQVDRIPQLQGELDNRNREALAREQESAQFRNQRDIQDQSRLSQETALANEFDLRIIGGDEFRKRYAEIQNEHAVAQSAVNRVFQRYQTTGELPSSLNQRAVVQYYNAFREARTESGRLDFPTLETTMQSLESEWTADQQAYVERNTGLREHPPLIEEFIQAKAILRPYWGVIDTIQPSYPNVAAGWERYKNASEIEQASMRRGSAILRDLVAALNDRRQGLRVQKPEIDAILVKWGYSTSPHTAAGFAEYRKLLGQPTAPTAPSTASATSSAPSAAELWRQRLSGGNREAPESAAQTSLSNAERWRQLAGGGNR